MAGPQIVSAVFLATNPRWGRCSLAYVAGAALSILAVCTIAYLAASFVRDLVGVSAPGSSRPWFCCRPCVCWRWASAAATCYRVCGTG
ncbi:hypothetical protein SAMN04489717_4536 [Actinopolymorpha singaporensis]|uniref:Uncharacterized protein n=1 Tax=Actinopolymorpha singaporensis TaxID=117157 RepID=A0A1H1WLB9_9ACTN|nr:hypothetical protein SAMN04489717_4536 [Actinopolymorpha singaporensis]